MASVAPSNRVRSVLHAVRNASAPSYWLSANAASADEKGDGTDWAPGMDIDIVISTDLIPWSISDIDGIADITPRDIAGDI